MDKIFRISTLFSFDTNLILLIWLILSILLGFDKKVVLCYNVFHRVAVNSQRGISAASHCQLTSASV